MPLDLSTGRKIRFSEIQYEGIGFTLIDLKNSTFEIKEGLDFLNLTIKTILKSAIEGK